MKTTDKQADDAIAPGDRDLLERVQRVIDGHEGPLMIGREGASVEIPESLFHLLTKAVRLLASGQSVTLLSENEEFTTQAAANFLGMSRPFLVKLLEQGEIPFHFVGTHRRVYLKDLQAYQKRRSQERRSALDRIAAKVMAAGLDDADYTGEE